MKRWAAHLFITLYLAGLGFGVLAHSLNFLKTCHPAMYFLVWDMYCGWSAYESKLHVLGEGVSGQYYELAPGPWGSFHPFGELARHDGDVHAQFGMTFANNTLRHTQHEPIHRILVVEEAWPKKFNLPEKIWAGHFPEPKEPRTYAHLRATYAIDGKCLHRGKDFLASQKEATILSNPRLQASMRRGHTIYTSAGSPPASNAVTPASYEVRQ